MKKQANWTKKNNKYGFAMFKKSGEFMPEVQFCKSNKARRKLIQFYFDEGFADFVVLYNAIGIQINNENKGFTMEDYIKEV